MECAGCSSAAAKEKVQSEKKTEELWRVKLLIRQPRPR